MLALRNLNSLPNFVEEFFNHELPNSWNKNWVTASTPAVNVIEGKNEFKIEVAAPGLNKEDFKINLDNDLLTISANKEVKTEENDEKYTRREFSYSSFSRAFTLPETVLGESISAEHKDGVLCIHVPKKEDAIVKPVREIAIA